MLKNLWIHVRISVRIRVYHWEISKKFQTFDRYTFYITNFSHLEKFHDMSFWEFWEISMEIFRAGEILVISHFVENALILIDIHFGKIFHFGTLGQKWDSETLIMTWPNGGLISILNVLSSKIIRPVLWDFEREVYLLVARNYSISKRELTICKCNTVVT